MEYIKTIFHLATKVLRYMFNKIQLVIPIISGGAALSLLREIILKSEGDNLKWGSIVLTITFLASACLFAFLSKIEKDKDAAVVTAIRDILESIFRRWGQKLAEKNADMANAKDMNQVLKTTVVMIEKMESLIKKNYKNSGG
jgi:hypothetical protein